VNKDLYKATIAAYMEVESSPKSLASSLTGESVVTFSRHLINLLLGVFKSRRSFTSAFVDTHSAQQHDPLEPQASDIIRIQLYNKQRLVLLRKLPE